MLGDENVSVIGKYIPMSTILKTKKKKTLSLKMILGLSIA